MNQHMLREIAKFLAGAVTAKLIILLWLSEEGLLPYVLRHTGYAGLDIWPGVIFGIALIIILSYYGWHIKSPVHSPTEYRLLTLLGFIFLVIAVVHFVRLAFDWQVVIGSLDIPIWVSWFGVVIAGYLSYASFHFAFRMRRR